MASSLTIANRGWTVVALGGLLSLGLLAQAVGNASASEIIDLRIGAHEEFTRVVFELDRPTGYRIERASPEPGVSDLVISIDATSIPRKVQAKNELIGLVQITPRGSGALAEIRLAREGLRLKEMILSSPPRIVLDILAPQPTKNKAKTVPTVARQTSEPKPAAKKPTVPKPAVGKPKPTRVVSPKAPVAPVAKAKPPQVKKAVVPQAKSTAPPVAIGDPKQTRGENLPKSAPNEKRLALEKPAYGLPGTGKEPIEAEMALLELEAEEVVLIPPEPGPSPEALKLEDLKQKPHESESGSGAIWATLLGIVAMTILLLAMRRRRASLRSDEFDEGVEVGGSPDGSENPFSNRAASSTGKSLTMAEDTMNRGVSELELEMGELAEDPEKEATLAEGPFLDRHSAYRQNPESQAQNIGADAGLGPADEEMKRMLSEFQQRMESMERRLDEVSEARERLERQVAAQTEELRVQRAAIARTQRAVRNMNRPDEEGPTEPAPRQS